MNFRKLLTYLTMGTAAAMPIATAQNPTILQGNYITNVFGNSNFLLNPNAQTNIANVTVSNATVTRSTTTPLVATSEFTVTTSTATGSATWSTRTFDAGMKNQNCEARFSYRGFSVGSTTAQILQGANVVAQLTLTASTDPRIASINFPCGDLSSATTFRLQQATASLTGTNEIGGIYVGLATNMANVAQAEFVGSVRFGTNCLWSTTSSTFNSPIDTTCSTTAIGNVSANTVANTKPSIIVNDTRPGNYYAVWSGGSFQKAQVATYQWCAIQITDSITPVGGYVDPSNLANFQVFSLSQNFQYTTSGSRTISVEMKSSDNTTSCTLNTSTNEAQLTVYRFPSSSELVVKPETQNVWGAVEYRNQNQSLFSGSAEPTGYSSFNNATWNQPTLLKGKAAVTTTNSGNDLGFSIPNLPVGSYKLEITGALYAQAGTTVDNITVCTFRILETTTSTTVAEQVIQGARPTAGTNTANLVNNFQGIFNNTAVATRNFRLETNKTNDTNATNTGSCSVVSSASGNVDATIISFTITPLDQPSNSALYVQGPVLGAQTGAAIPTGYVGEVLSADDGAYQNTTSNQYNVLSLALTPGVWDVSGKCLFNQNSATITTANWIGSITNQNANPSDSMVSWLAGSSFVNATAVAIPTEIVRVRWDGTTNVTPGSTNTSSNLVYIRCFPGVFTGGPVQVWRKIWARRIN